jgi:hypothetical protein
MTLEGLGEMFEGDSADMCAGILLKKHLLKLFFIHQFLNMKSFDDVTLLNKYLLVGGKTHLVMMPARTVKVVVYFESTYS